MILMILYLFSRMGWFCAFGLRKSGRPLALLLLILVVLTLGACQTPPVVRPLDGGSTPVSAPAPRLQSPVAVPVTVNERQITLLSYPFELYQTAAFDPYYRWPYQRFDVERFRTEAPAPSPRPFRLVTLENEYLKLLFLPELGGRLWQVIHKPTGGPMFYQNQTVKPTHWGQPNQLGWLALGGLEWGLPVIEHGYDWGVPWEYMVERQGDHAAAIVFSTPDDGRLLQASIRVALAAGEARFTVEPTLANRSHQTLNFSFWVNAALAPGSGGQPSAGLRFILPAHRVKLHSTADTTLPAPAQSFAWPVVNGRDLSRLGNWRQYLGFFESPSAQGPFAGVYDPAYDAGAVRIFPPAVARGSKVFALGWHDALESNNYTDDHSVYVELHGGIAPSFFDQAQLPAHNTLTWRETWYPAHGIEDFVVAAESGALNVTKTGGGLRIGFYPTQPFSGVLEVTANRHHPVRLPIEAGPDDPFRELVAVGAPTSEQFKVQIEDPDGRVLISYEIP
jgi:hypothetical protein